MYPKVTAWDMLDHFARLKGVADAKQRRATVEALLERTNLSAVRKQKLGGFSGGMRQRFGIAQALIGNPKLIIVDEPTAGLDPEERVRFHNLLADIGRDVIVILSTHIVDDVADLCPRFAVISKGRVLLEGEPREAVARLTGRIWQRTVDRAELDGVLADASGDFHAPAVGTHRPARLRGRRSGSRVRGRPARAGGRVLQRRRRPPGDRRARRRPDHGNHARHRGLRAAHQARAHLDLRLLLRVRRARRVVDGGRGRCLLERRGHIRHRQAEHQLAVRDLADRHHPRPARHGHRRGVHGPRGAAGFRERDLPLLLHEPDRQARLRHRPLRRRRGDAAGDLPRHRVRDRGRRALAGRGAVAHRALVPRRIRCGPTW